MKLCLIATVFIMLLWQDGADARSHQRLDLLVRELHRRNGDCEALANNVVKAINYYMQIERPDLGAAFIGDFLERATGINVLDLSEMRRVMCRLTEADTVRGLKEAFEELDITSHLLTMTYNMLFGSVHYYITVLERAMDRASNDTLQVLEAGIELLILVDESYLSGLDPEGSQWVIDNVFSRDLRSRRAHSQRERGTTEDLCEDLVEAVDRFISLVGRDFDVLEELLGIDMQDENLRHQVVCDIAGISSIQEGIEVLENTGMLDHLFTYLYGNLANYIQYFKHYYEEVQAEAEESGDSDDWPIWKQRRLHQAEIYLPVNNELDASGLLDLESDLVEG